MGYDLRGSGKGSGMAKVMGVGGVFFKSADPAAARAWYREMLGFEFTPHDSAEFMHAGSAAAFGAGGRTVWSAFRADTDYFGPSQAPFMVNLMVDDLDGMMERLRGKGVALAGGPEDYEYGRFAWVIDPDGVKIELWQPPKA
ncbi:MAG: VOC family protein [Maricaulaceae bacterium]|nr:VOC family protein [Maricaulaceae bacterium]